MLLKKRSQSDELLVLRSLDLRTKLSKKDKFRYSNLEKGYDGEVKFDLLLENMNKDRLILNDLLFDVDYSYFQIDTLIISRGVIHLIDIKNFAGDCYLEGDKLYSLKSNWEYNNPITQLKRCESLFTQLLQRLKYNYLIKPFVIFTNPTFSLYQAPIDQPIIFPSQVSRLIDNLNSTAPQLSRTEKDLAQKLISLHQPKNPFTFLPDYHYQQLRKGVYCSLCKSFQVLIENHSLVCSKCGAREKTRLAILRHTQEFQLLFPDQKITTNRILEWCDLDVDKKTVRRVLKQNYKSIGRSSDTYYEIL